MTQEVISKSLYDDDFLLWAEDTVRRLKARDFDNLDIDNLVEEIEDLGKSNKNKVRGFLDILLIHLLKRCYVVMPDCYRGWQNEIREYRRKLELLLEDSPSLKPYLASKFDNSFAYALRHVREDYPQYQFPDTWQFNRDIEALLNTIFWESGSNGSN